MIFRCIHCIAVILLVPASLYAQGTTNSSVDKWFNGANCPQPQKDLFYFRIGKQAFHARTKDVRNVQLKSLGSLSRDGKVQIQLPKDAGCRSNPIHLLTVGLEPNSHALPKYVVLTETPERTEGMSFVTKYIVHLNKIKACHDTKSKNLILCAGSRDGGKVRINFLIVVDDKRTIIVPASGVPLHARCEDAVKPVICTVIEELENDVTVRAQIDFDSISAETIRSLHQQLVRFATDRRAR